MRGARTALGALLILAGGLFFVQGIGLLPGSFMSSRLEWAVIGGAGLLLGLALIAQANWPRRPGQ